MIVKKFDREKDYDRISAFLSEQYMINRNMLCWLPQRFDDLVFRLETLYVDERKGESSLKHILIVEDHEEIVGLVLPDGDSFNSCIRNGYEFIFPRMLDMGEKELAPLFKKDENGEIDFLVVSHDRLTYQAEELKKRGYTKDEAGDFDNVVRTAETNFQINPPAGFRQVYGFDYPDIVKMRACHYGFEPEYDDGDLYKEYDEGGECYQTRKQSRFFNDSFESLIVSDDNDICAYSFCYVDQLTKTAFIEPVSTRQKSRGKGFCREMMHGIINKCKEIGIQNVYVNSYDWRKRVYNSAGFITEDTIGIWHKKIRPSD